MRLPPPAGVAFGVTLVSACTAEGPPDRPPAAPLDTLVVAVPADAHDLLSPLAQTSFDQELLDLIGARPLDADFACELKFRPELARSWQWSADGLQLDLTLRDDFVWEDGTPVTASDLALAGEFAADPVVASPRADGFQLLDPKARPEVVDAHHVRYRFIERANPSVMTATATLLQVVPRHLLGVGGLNRSALRDHPLNATAPMASGRWRVERWERGKALHLVPNPVYPDPPPGLRRVSFRVLPEYADRVAALRAGAVDLVEGITVADADELASAGFRIARRGYRAMDFIGWNQVDPVSLRAPVDPRRPAPPAPHPLFADPRVREALTSAIDIDALIAETLTSRTRGERFAERAVGTITPELCDMRPAITPLAFSPDRARALLAEAGWSDTNGDGVVDREGVPFRFSLLLPGGSPRRESAAAMVQAGLQAVGVDAQIEVIDPGVLVQRLLVRDFDAVYTGWTSALWPDARSTWGADGAYNITSFRDTEAEALLEAATSESDAAQAALRWQAFQSRVYGQQPYTFLFWVDEVIAIDSRFENARVGLASPWQELDQWTVPPDRVKYAD
jgi:peptide/nickel transport system substrate-binding protein